MTILANLWVPNQDANANQRNEDVMVHPYINRKVDKAGILITIFLILSTVYYCFWRIEVVNWIYWWVALPLIVAEVFGILHLFGFNYTIWPRSISCRDNFEDIIQHPVYILIVTVNETIDVLEATLRGALSAQMLYLASNPDAQVSVVLCNDGRAACNPYWENAEELANYLKVACITRCVGGGAKAGNVEYARQQLGATGDALVAIFDADMVPEPEFLVETIPLFSDPSVGWVQTGQYYRNIDNPVARWANDQQQLFYRLLCPGKAAVNAAFICGTNVVIRASALDEIGGLPQDSVTEDLAASILLHPRWRSVYLTDVLAQGLGPVDLATYFTQQRRWAIGTFGVLFRHWRSIFLPWHKGLTLPQRIQYLLCCTHYFCGVRDLICLISPLAFLCLGIPALKDIALLSFLVHFLPYWIISQLAFWYAAKGKAGFLAVMHGTILGFGSFPTLVSSLVSTLQKKPFHFTVTVKQPRKTDTWSQLQSHSVMSIFCVVALCLYSANAEVQWFGLISALWVLYMLGLFGGMLWLGIMERQWIQKQSSIAVSTIQDERKATHETNVLSSWQTGLKSVGISLVMVALGAFISQVVIHYVLSLSATTATYMVTELGTLGGNNIFHGGGGINNFGQVVGRSDTFDSHSRAFLWEEGRMHGLSTHPAGETSTAFAINDNAQVVGFAQNSMGEDHAFLWQNGQMQDLGTLPGYRCSVAAAINNRGQIVGRVYNPQPEQSNLLLWPSRAVIWNKGKPTDIGSLPGCTSSRAYAINDRGEVVGWSLARNGMRRAFLLRNGKMIDLSAGSPVSAATGIDNQGQVIGNFGATDNDMHAFIWKDGRRRDLGTILGHTFNRASAINDQGQVVGESRTGEEYTPPFIWDSKNGMRSLNSLLPAHSGWYLTHAFSINNRGEILAWGQYKQQERMCLLEPSHIMRPQ